MDKKLTMKSHIATLTCFLPICLLAQGTGLPLGNPAYHILDRLEVKTGLQPTFHASLKYYNRGDAVRYAINVDTSAHAVSVKDRRDLYYIFKDNNEWLSQSDYATTLAGKNELAFRKVYVDSTQTFYTIEESQARASLKSDYYILRENPILKYFYKTPANFFELDRKDFFMRLNPIINFQLAKEAGHSQLVFANQRGVELRGGIDDRIFFHASILESQAGFPEYVEAYINHNFAIPGYGLYKSYKSEIFDIENGYDFLNAQGYAGFNISKHVGLQIGHGRNFIGNGDRSLLLSDFSNNYFYLKLNTRIWKLHYQNIFAELTTISSNDPRNDDLLPRKYMAAHYLSFRPTTNFNIGIYEAIIYSREDHFELQYLNPIILYRMVEQSLESPDNVLVGLDVKWNLLRHFQLYGQFLLDEFKFKELIVERRGWWANKFGIQMGAKYIDMFGIDHLDGQVELNSVRPYTYMHFDSTANYTHYNQPLAHPLGTNFRELLFKLRYQAGKRLLLEGRLITARHGSDADQMNWGNNLLLSYNNRPQEFEHEIGQGIENELIILGLDVSYQFFHNMYLDLQYFYRNNKMERISVNSQYFGGGLRINFARWPMDF